MSAVATLRMLTGGERPVVGLLHTARLKAFGIEVYGEEAIIAAFRNETIELSDKLVVVETSGHVAIFDDDWALFADLSGDAIARLWRLGGGDPIDSEAEVSVAFDADLAQARSDVFFAASDHPALAGDAADRVAAVGRAVTSGDPEAYRVRAHVIRAFGTAHDGAALFAVHRLGGDPVHSAGFAMAAARWTADSMHIVRDRVGEAAIARRPWNPRVGA